MPVVCSAFGHQLDLSAAAPTHIGGDASGNSAKFLHGIDGLISDGGKGLASGLVIGVNAVDGDISLVRTRTSDCSIAIAIGVV